MSDQEGPVTGGDEWAQGVGDLSMREVSLQEYSEYMTAYVDPEKPVEEFNALTSLADDLSMVWKRAYENLAGDEEEDGDGFASDFAAAGASQVVRAVATILAAPQQKEPDEEAAAELRVNQYAGGGSFVTSLPGYEGRIFLRPEPGGVLNVTWIAKVGHRTRQVRHTLVLPEG